MVNNVILEDEKREDFSIVANSSSSSAGYGSMFDDSSKDQPFLDESVFMETDTLTWTEDEEAKILGKIDRHLMSFVLLLTFVLNLDRTNLSNALSDNMAADLGFTNDGVNLSIMVYSILFTFFTLPSNAITKRIGAHLWIPIMMTSWAIVTWCHALIQDFTGFMIVRALIAVTEAGFIPACLFYLTAFYKTNELATRLAYFWGAQALASCVSGIMSFFVFRLEGVMGLEGWKWLFLTDGILTHLVGFFAFAYLPDSPADAKKWLTRREHRIALLRILRDDDAKKDQHKPLTWPDVELALKDTNLYVHLAIAFVGLMPHIPMNTYLPSIIRSFGFPSTTANLLAAPAVMIGLAFSVWIAKSSDRHGQVALHGLVGAVWSLMGFCLLRFVLPEHVQGTDGVTGGVSKWVFYAVNLFTAAAPSSHGMHIAWMSSNLAPVGKRTLALGAIIGAANINGVPGSMIYQSNDAPRYHHGNLICVYLSLATLLLWLFQRSRYVYINKSRQIKWNSMSDHDKHVYMSTTTDLGNNRLDYRFHL